MSEVVLLKRNDDFGAIEGKIAAASAEKIVVIIPRGLSTLRSPVRFQLMLRRARYLAKDLVLVVQDRKTREVARGQGVPVYATRRILRREDRIEQRFQGTQYNLHRGLNRPLVTGGLPGIFLAVFFVGLVALSVGAGVILLPTATVAVSPVTQVISDTVTITATTNVKKGQASSKEIPARVLQSTVEGADAAQATGQRARPDARASGQVTFMNKTESPVSIPKGTVVTTAGSVKFMTVDDASVPTSNWSTVRVGIIAAEPGLAGNVEALAINQIPDSSLGYRLTVLNENATQGGTDKQVSFVTATDRNQLKAKLLESMKGQGFQLLQGSKKESESIYRQTINFIVTDEIFDRNVDEEGIRVTLRMKAAVSGLAFENKDVNDLTSELLKKRIPGGFQTIPDGLKLRPADVVSWDQEKVVFQVYALSDVTTVIDESKIKQELRGMNSDDAENYLVRSLHLTTRPRVEITPNWVKTVPWIDWRVDLKVISPR